MGILYDFMPTCGFEFSDTGIILKTENIKESWG